MMAGERRAADAAAKRHAFQLVAARLACQLVGDTTPFMTRQRLTARAVWFLDSSGERLVVVAGEHEPPESAVEVLSYALAWQADRDLLVVLPDGRQGEVLALLPWVATPVRVFVFGPDELVRPAIVPSRHEVLEAARDRSRPVRSPVGHDLGDRAAMVEPLAAFADGHWALVRADRPGYLAWHVAGRQALRMSRTASGVRVVAGVDATRPQQGKEPVDLRVGQAGVTPAQRAQVEAAVATAVAHRLAGGDRGHLEHRLQAALAAAELPGMGVRREFVAREYPAYRGERRPGFVDFLALDEGNRLHVVETKVGPDPTLAVQALQYATWVRANATEIRRERGWPAGPSEEQVVIDLALAPKSAQPAIGPYLAGVLEAFAGDVVWRVTLINDARAAVPATRQLPSRSLPMVGPAVAAPVTGPRWPTRVQAALCATAGLPVRRPFYPDSQSAMLPAAHPAHAELSASGLAHRFALHVRSSQAFALNLFAPLDEHGLRGVFAALGEDVVDVEPSVFEWSDREDRLGEARPASPHRTQVDVLLRGRDAFGARVSALVEVKFTELDFGECSAYTNAKNPTRHICRTAGLFGGDPGRCFQLLNHGSGRRAYDRYLDPGGTVPPHGAEDDGGCLVRRGRSQPMRNLALAHLLVSAGDADRVVYALCAPSGHRTIWRRFAEVLHAFPDTATCVVRGLPAETIAALHTDGGTALAAQYPLPELRWPAPTTTDVAGGRDAEGQVIEAGDRIIELVVDETGATVPWLYTATNPAQETPTFASTPSQRAGKGRGDR
jgi:hypothetical protein